MLHDQDELVRGSAGTKQLQDVGVVWQVGHHIHLPCVLHSTHTASVAGVTSARLRHVAAAIPDATDKAPAWPVQGKKHSMSADRLRCFCHRNL